MAKEIKRLKIKPLFIWSGGKTKMFKYYEPLLPENDIKSYSEPFFGGGAMFLHILEKYDLSNIYINDVNSGIIGIYKSIRDSVDDFCSILDVYQSEYLPLDKLNRKKYFYELRNKNAYDYHAWGDIKESVVLYFLMKTAFNGIWQINKNTNGRFGTPSGLLNQKDKVYDRDNVVLWNEALNEYKVEILNGDWKDCPMGDFTFYDPPYRDSFANYNTSFPDTETELLIDRVESGNNTWLSNRDSDDGFFENRNAMLYKFPITYTAGRRKKVERIDNDGNTVIEYNAKKATEILLISKTDRGLERFIDD